MLPQRNWHLKLGANEDGTEYELFINGQNYRDMPQWKPALMSVNRSVVTHDFKGSVKSMTGTLFVNGVKTTFSISHDEETKISKVSLGDKTEEFRGDTIDFVNDDFKFPVEFSIKGLLEDRFDFTVNG